jgi:hypothetical protein
MGAGFDVLCLTAQIVDIMSSCVVAPGNRALWPPPPVPGPSP